MSKKNKKEEVPMCCLTCENCIYIGEGDHMCDAMDEPVIVMEDHTPNDNYFICGGSEYVSYDEEDEDYE